MTGEYEPNDSRNVTGNASTQDGRWTTQQGRPPEAAGQPQQGQPGAMGQAGMGQAGMDPVGDRDRPEQQADGGYADSGQQRQFDQQGGQMGSGGSASHFADRIREHMRVVDGEGNEIGRVDSCDGEQIKLTRRDSADGEHHYLEMRDVEAIDGDTVRLRADGNSETIEGFGQGV